MGCKGCKSNTHLHSTKPRGDLDWLSVLSVVLGWDGIKDWESVYGETAWSNGNKLVLVAQPSSQTDPHSQSSSPHPQPIVRKHDSRQNKMQWKWLAEWGLSGVKWCISLRLWWSSRLDYGQGCIVYNLKLYLLDGQSQCKRLNKNNKAVQTWELLDFITLHTLRPKAFQI